MMDHGFKILCTLDVEENILETKFYVQEIRISSHELQQGGRRSKRNYPRTCSSDSLPKCLFISFYLSDFTYPIFPFCNRPNLRKKGPFRVYILFSPRKRTKTKRERTSRRPDKRQRARVPKRAWCSVKVNLRQSVAVFYRLAAGVLWRESFRGFFPRFFFL